ncbi:MAG: Bro-N domain-containing protein [Pseudomonadota bacterium]|jgi:BRO family, N-terminal domain
MTNALTCYYFEEVAIRVVMVAGEPWFIAKDICGVLGLSNTSQALSRLDEDEKGVILSDTLGGAQELNAVSESGMYGLVMSSRKPEGRRFRKWVTAEVLPSIRKTGKYELPGYEPPPTLPDDINFTNIQIGVNAVRTAMRLFGNAEARSIWVQLGLPAPIVDSLPVLSGDNLAEPLKAWLEDKTETTAVWAARGIGLTDIDRMTTTRISALLRLFGWVRHESKRDGVKVNLWFRPDAAPAGAK